MSISPFSARPTSPDSEGKRVRLIVAIAILGIAATLLAYAISPGVRHAVGHAAHSVKGTVSHVLDHDQTKHSPAPHPAAPAAAPKR
jgi:type II secretory pathway pseudopilin PulG